MSEKFDLKKGYEVFHSPCAQTSPNVTVVLVRPEFGGNVGSIARAMANFGITSPLRIVGRGADVLDAECRKMAVHAGSILDNATFHASLDDLFSKRTGKFTRVAATARIASAHRPHPLRVDQLLPRLVEKGNAGELDELYFVFGCESDGLSNEEVAACDQIASIPSAPEYRSLNLSQAVMVFLYEWNRARLLDAEQPVSTSRGQKQKLIAHFIRLAEEVGFVLPGDPFKMRPRLEKILSALPPYLPEVKTLHGLFDQISRSVKKGSPDVRGRYRQHWESPGGELLSPKEPLV